MRAPSAASRTSSRPRSEPGLIGQCIVVSPPNDQWPYATDISSTTAGGAPDDRLRRHGRPGPLVQVHRPARRKASTSRLTGLSADDDVFLFKDISAAYAALAGDTATPDEAERRVRRGGCGQRLHVNAFTSNAFTSNAFTCQCLHLERVHVAMRSRRTPSRAMRSRQCLHAQCVHEQCVHVERLHAQCVHVAMPSRRTRSRAMRSRRTPSRAMRSHPTASSTRTGSTRTPTRAPRSRSVIARLGQLGTGVETFDANTWTNTGTFYVRVNGKDDASSDQPFTLSVQLQRKHLRRRQPDPWRRRCRPATTRRPWSSGTPAGSAVQAGDIATLRTTLGDQTTGARSPVRRDRRGRRRPRRPAFAGHPHRKPSMPRRTPTRLASTQRTSSPSAIKDIVTAYRAANPTSQYVVLVGDDASSRSSAIPDQNSLGPEKDYSPPVDPTQRLGGQPPLRLRPRPGRVRLHDEPVARDLRIPDTRPAVGRLVETAAEADRDLRRLPGHTTNGVVAPTGAADRTRPSSPATTSSPMPRRRSRTTLADGTDRQRQRTLIDDFARPIDGHLDRQRS